MVFAWGVGWGEPGSLLPEDVETGESEGRSSDGLCRLEAGGTQDARLIAGGRFIGIQSSANEQNAAGDEDGLLPADEYFRISLQDGAGLQELCVIWTRAAITITGFQSNPGVVLPGAASEIAPIVGEGLRLSFLLMGMGQLLFLMMIIPEGCWRCSGGLFTLHREWD